MTTEKIQEIPGMQFEVHTLIFRDRFLWPRKKKFGGTVFQCNI